MRHVTKLIRSGLIFCILVIAAFAQAKPAVQYVELKIGETLDLRQFGGPNMNFAVVEIDVSDVIVKVEDYDRMQIRGGGNAYSGYSVSSSASATNNRVKKEDRALLYSWTRGAVVYMQDAGTAQNHVRVAVVFE